MAITPIYCQPLPPQSQGAVASLALSARPDGAVLLGHNVRAVPSLTRLSLGLEPPLTREHAAERADDVLLHLLGTLATLMDWPPFP